VFVAFELDLEIGLANRHNHGAGVGVVEVVVLGVDGEVDADFAGDGEAEVGFDFEVFFAVLGEVEFDLLAGLELAVGLLRASVLQGLDDFVDDDGRFAGRIVARGLGDEGDGGLIIVVEGCGLGELTLVGVVDGDFVDDVEGVG